MKMVKRVKAFFELKWETKKLLLEAYLYLGWARFLKTRPFVKIASSLGQKMEETTYTPNMANRETLLNVSNAIHIMSRYTFWESQCLVKAIAGLKMLEKRNIESTLYLGTGKDDEGKFAAHAWLRSGPFYVSGSEGMEKFTVIAKFAKEITPEKVEGETYG
ncbi:lasso peptide biosynthesis B2 protein [Alkalihalobacillus sp. MEB130]|uniref:lasso peptide biosynthesis B2 protein n=1 Tax=Alkalihalobacillus sp. MEB130 TaxID=2976704 RepID=UPI0028DD7AD6|nr:lasso peptide biosynthesis B2 protein [Alkalihalobacillus sp. MEB130]MDT8861082.1 lasso peptide biosynthesis B2 protein [Alkalihalobacillus sp. MEB130]